MTQDVLATHATLQQAITKQDADLFLSLLSASQLFFLLPGSSEAALNQGLWALAAALDKLALSQTEPLAHEMAINALARCVEKQRNG